MECCKVVPIGEKIKALRNRYDLKQDDIVGTDVTRNLISQIENGKAKLTRSTAEIIITHAKEKISEKNLSLDIDINYLLEDEEAQAKKILDEYIEELKKFIENNDSSFIRKLAEAEEFTLRWNYIDKKIIICELAGDYFYKNNNFSKAIVYYEIVRRLEDIHSDTFPLVPVLRKLSRSYYFMARYNEGIDICTYALNRFSDIDNDSKIAFLYNRSLFYNCLKEYNKAIEFMEQLINVVNKNERNEYTRVLLLKASCLYNLKRYNEALNTYHELLKIAGDEDYGNKALYFNNLTEIYLETGKFQEANEYLRKVIELIKIIPEDFHSLPHLYLEVGRRYIQLKDYSQAKTYLIQSLALAKKFKYSFIISDSIMELVHITKENTDIDIKDEFLDLVSTYGEVNNVLLVNVLQYFATLNNNKTIEDICIYCNSYLKNA